MSATFTGEAKSVSATSVSGLPGYLAFEVRSVTAVPLPMAVNISRWICVAVMVPAATMFNTTLAVPDKAGEPLSVARIERVNDDVAVVASAVALETTIQPAESMAKRPSVLPLRIARVLVSLAFTSVTTTRPRRVPGKTPRRTFMVKPVTCGT